MRVLVGIILCLFSLRALCGPGHITGNGGDGVVINGKVYLFDLYEYSVHENPYFDDQVEPDELIYDMLYNKFLNFKDTINDNRKTYIYADLIKLIAKKLTSLQKLDPLFSTTILTSIIHYNWVLSTQDVIDIKDDDGSDIIYDEELIAVAVRSYRTIKVSNHRVKQMDLKNFVATIFHEAIYGVIPQVEVVEYIPYKKKVTNPDGTVVETDEYKQEVYYKQLSRRVREITGAIFSKSLSKLELLAVISGSFPTTEPESYYDISQLQNLNAKFNIKVTTVPIYSSGKSKSYTIYGIDQSSIHELTEVYCENFMGKNLGGKYWFENDLDHGLEYTAIKPNFESFISKDKQKKYRLNVYKNYFFEKKRYSILYNFHISDYSKEHCIRIVKSFIYNRLRD